jgi:hypothetical protein
MADLLVDSQGRPVPQYLGAVSGAMEAQKGAGGAMYVAVLVALPAGTNKIGSVDVATLPSIPIGSNLIGKVDINSLPALPVGTNIIGKVDVNSLPVLPTGANNIGKVDVNSLPVLPTGDNNIGNVDVLTLPSLPVGSNIIGSVNEVPAKFTASMQTIAAAGSITVKATAGYIAKITTSLTDLIIINGTTQIWVTGGSVDFNNPVYCDTSIVLSSVTGGSVSIEYM